MTTWNMHWSESLLSRAVGGFFIVSNAFEMLCGKLSLYSMPLCKLLALDARSLARTRKAQRARHAKCFSMRPRNSTMVRPNKRSLSPAVDVRSAALGASGQRGTTASEEAIAALSVPGLCRLARGLALGMLDMSLLF